MLISMEDDDSINKYIWSLEILTGLFRLSYSVIFSFLHLCIFTLIYVFFFHRLFIQSFLCQNVLICWPVQNSI